MTQPQLKNPQLIESLKRCAALLDKVPTSELSQYYTELKINAGAQLRVYLASLDDEELAFISLLALNNIGIVLDLRAQKGDGHWRDKP